MKLCTDIHVDRVASPAGNLTKSLSPEKYIVQALNWQQKGNKTQEAGDTTFDTDIHGDQRIDFNDFADPPTFPTAHHEAHMCGFQMAGQLFDGLLGPTWFPQDEML